ncbi:MAG: hypothetical protein JW734_00710 [Candidatus Omnitrophica bacterium]|nr:hypothetical protein [Candidatus Omnitrophota bacterium]
MKKFIFVSLLLFSFCLGAEDINISGICDDKVIIGDRTFEVGDNYQGLEITKITEDSVTFKDSEGKEFIKSLEYSYWDKFTERTRYFFNKISRDTKSFIGSIGKKAEIKKVNVSNLSIEEKMRLADNYLEEYRKEADVFLDKLESENNSPQQLADKIDGYNKIIQDYVDKHNALKLPCPMSSKTRNNPAYSGYVYWSEGFRSSEQRIMDNFDQRRTRILEKAGFR